jgi:hypothetical protein
MIPADVVKECASEGELTERLQENAHEVLNIAASLFNQPGFEHLVLAEVVLNKELPEPVSALMAKPALRADLEGAIEGYPPGSAASCCPDRPGMPARMSGYRSVSRLRAAPRLPDNRGPVRDPHPCGATRPSGSPPRCPAPPD